MKHILQDHLLQHTLNLYQKDYFCFQQDSAPSYKAMQSQPIGSLRLEILNQDLR
jgi:hypothetical protein